MNILGSILLQKNLVVRRSTMPQLLVVLAKFLVVEGGHLNFATLGKQYFGK